MANETEQRGSRPDPDPSVLTTRGLEREIKGLRELVEQRIDGLGGLLTERIERVNERVTLLDKQRESEKENADRALQVALDSVEKQLNTIRDTHTTAVDALRREASELSNRVGRVEFGPSPPTG